MSIWLMDIWEFPHPQHRLKISFRKLSILNRYFFILLRCLGDFLVREIAGDFARFLHGNGTLIKSNSPQIESNLAAWHVEVRING